MKKSKHERINLFLGLGATAKGAGTLGPFGALTLQALKSHGKVGRKVNKKDLEGPEVCVWFSDSKAVEALIEDLASVAHDILKVEKGIKDASARITVGYPDVVIDVSGAGKGPIMHKSGKDKRGGSR